MRNPVAKASKNPTKAAKTNIVSRVLDRFARHKDGITGLLAASFVVVGAFQYLEYRADLRISAALDMLKRRETSIFVEARAKLISKWLETEKLHRKFAGTEIYTLDLIEAISTEIFADKEYRESILHISAYYHNAAGCAVDGVCDAPMICSSLGGEIQDYLDVNKGYFAFARSVRYEDAVSLYLSLPEFGNYCDADLGALVFSRHDRSYLCQTGLYAYRISGFTGLANAFCRPEETDYGQEIIDAAKQIRLQENPVESAKVPS